jgi:hypothetical protein
MLSNFCERAAAPELHFSNVLKNINNYQQILHIKVLSEKNIWHYRKQIWTHCCSVVSYYVVIYRFLNTDTGTNPTSSEFTTTTPASV